MVGILPGLREGAIVPDVAVVGKGIRHIAQLTLFLVLKISTILTDPEFSKPLRNPKKYKQC
jgi:hypothetical protein